MTTALEDLRALQASAYRHTNWIYPSELQPIIDKLETDMCELRDIAKAIEVGWDTSHWKRPNIPDELRVIAGSASREGGAK